MNTLKTIAAAVGITALSTAGTAQSTNESANEILNNIQSGAELAIYQYDTTQGFCDTMQVNVLPRLNAVDLEHDFEAVFNKASGTISAFCAIEYGGERISLKFADSLDMGETFDPRDTAEDILEALSRDDLVKVSAVLPSLMHD